MKIANLVVAIIFSVMYFAFLTAGLVDGDDEIVLGILIISPPVILNWISFANWNNKKN